MIAKDYRVLKSKGVVEINTEKEYPEYLRPVYNSITGDVFQIRSDVINVTVLKTRRAELLEEINDISALLADVGAALDARKELP